MPRPRKSSKKPKNEPAAAPVTGAAQPPGWTPPRGQAVPAATPPNGAPEPPPAVQPQIRIEQVPNADRPTFKVYGHDAAASTYVQRAREFEDEERELAAGKKYFRDLASDLRAQHGMLSHLDVVAYLGQIVDPGSASYPRHADGRPVDRHVRTDPDSVLDLDGPDLWNLVILA